MNLPPRCLVVAVGLALVAGCSRPTHGRTPAEMPGLRGEWPVEQVHYPSHSTVSAHGADRFKGDVLKITPSELRFADVRCTAPRFELHAEDALAFVPSRFDVAPSEVGLSGPLEVASVLCSNGDTFGPIVMLAGDRLMFPQGGALLVSGPRRGGRR